MTQIRVGEFEKVSYVQFYKDINPDNEFEDEDIKKIYEAIELPSRATSGSAGYDFKSPVSFTLHPNESIKIPTGIRVSIEDSWFLSCLPRSGMGFKYQARLANTMAVIDSDYYHGSNEGHIFIKIVNGGQKDIQVEQGDGFAQGIFIPYGITHSDNAQGIRDGGLGSTGK